MIEDYFPDPVPLLLDLQNHLLPQELSRVKLSHDEAGKNGVSGLFWVFSGGRVVGSARSSPDENHFWFRGNVAKAVATTANW